jgi:hypothetical protein
MISKLEKAVLILSSAIAIATAIIPIKTLCNPSNYQPNSTKLKAEAHQLMKDYCPISGTSALLATASMIPSARRRHYLKSPK